MIEKYGQLSSEKLAEENTVARQIVREISQFGISDRQRYLIIYYLSLELENIENVKSLSDHIKEIYPELNLTNIYEGNR